MLLAQVVFKRERFSACFPSKFSEQKYIKRQLEENRTSFITGAYSTRSNLEICDATYCLRCLKNAAFCLLDKKRHWLQIKYRNACCSSDKDKIAISYWFL